jgi:heme exporter protein A
MPIFAGLSFTVGPGEALLIRGPNGAGKSTLLRCLAGLLKPALGSVAWDGREGAGAEDEGDWRPRTLHFVAHQTALKPALTARQNLRFLAGLTGTRPAPEAIDAALARVGLTHACEAAAGRLSAGQQRRLSLARLIVAPRPLWLLDEPTTALDTQGQALVADLIEAHLRGGGLVLAATHQEIAVEGVRTLTLAPVTAAAVEAGDGEAEDREVGDGELGP